MADFSKSFSAIQMKFQMGNPSYHSWRFRRRNSKLMKGSNIKAKANAAQAVKELIEIATNKKVAPDYQEKHKNKARYGWYRYDTRLALPIYNDVGELQRYNIYKLRMLVRHDSDGKLYLYDFLRTKKETSSPLE